MSRCTIMTVVLDFMPDTYRPISIGAKTLFIYLFFLLINCFFIE